MTRATVGFDATAAVRQAAGIGRYTRELLAALGDRDDDLRYRLIAMAGGETQGRLPLLDERFGVLQIPISDRLSNALWHRARVPLPVQLLTGRIDLFHSPDFTLPPAPGVPSVVTVHDLAFLAVPETAYPTLRAYLEEVVPRSLRRAAKVIAVSECTRQDLVERLGVPMERITVVHEGVSSVFRETAPAASDQEVLSRLRVSRPFVLGVGTIQPRKNYARLVEAFAAIWPRHQELSLVIAGSRGWMDEPVFAAIENLGLRDKVHIVGPGDEDLAALYRSCAVMAYPSLYEGFGIPPLEAMACGAPVICSNTSSLPEVVGDAAVMVDPSSTEQLAAALIRVLEDPELSARLRERGHERARLFTWERAAAETVGVYEDVLRGG